MTPYQENIDGLLKLHESLIEGKKETDEYDNICALLDMSYQKLTEVERKRIEGLSIDLYTVSDNKTIENVNWDSVLESLRQMNDKIPIYILSYIRGMIWKQLGQEKVAKVFLNHGSEKISTLPA